MRRPSFYYGWVIVAVAFVCLALAYSAWHSFSIFFVAILAEFGWSRASTALVGSLIMVVYALFSPVSGFLVDRLGPRVVIPAGGVVLAGGLFASSRIAEPWHIYLFYGVITAIGINLVGNMANFVVLANWFSRRRGTAVGIASSGIGLGMLIIVPSLQAIINTAGWRTALLALGLTVLVVVPAVAAIFHRHRPEDMGLLPDGGPAAVGKAAAARPRPALRVVDHAWAERNWTIRSAAATGRFWLMLCAFLLGSLSHQSVMVHQVAYLVDRGLDPMWGASMVGLVGICGSGGKVLWGWVSDRIGREGAYTLGMACVLAGVLILGLVVDPTQPWRTYLYAAVFGVGYGVTAPLSPLIIADVFQGKRFGSIYGMVYIGSGAGAAIGPWVSGLLFDLTRSYTASFTMSVVAAALSALGIWLAAPRKVRQVPGLAARHDLGVEASQARN